MRQKVKGYFLCGFAASGFARPAFGCPAAFGLVPVQSAKMGRRSLPFFGVKARKPTTHLHDPVGAHCVRPLAATRRDGLRAHAGRPYARSARAGFSLLFHGLQAKLALPSNPD
jgi:hypothetical protein